MNGNTELLSGVKTTQPPKSTLRTRTVEVMVLVQSNDEHPDGEEKPIAAFTSEVNLQKFLQNQPELTDYQVKRVKLKYNPKQPLYYLYLAYILTDDKQKVFSGYYINRLDAQRRTHKKGFIRSIPLNLDGEAASTVEQSKTKSRKMRGSSKLLNALEELQLEESGLDEVKASNESTIYQPIAMAIILVVFLGTIAYWLI